MSARAVARVREPVQAVLSERVTPVSGPDGWVQEAEWLEPSQSASVYDNRRL